jgi:hypothetical protein
MACWYLYQPWYQQGWIMAQMSLKALCHCCMASAGVCSYRLHAAAARELLL